MFNENLCLVVIFLTIFVLFYFLNIFFTPNIENYGTYCGRYNLDRQTALTKCKGDNECKWNKYSNKFKNSLGSISNDSDTNGWCGQNKFDHKILTLNSVMDDVNKVPKFLNTIFNINKIDDEES
jgi:hypothetical protein